MRFFLLFVMMLCLIHPALAEEAEVPSVLNVSECAAQFKRIEADMREARSCWVDADCVAVTFGCPWQKKACDFTIISTENPDKLDALVGNMAQYQQRCVQQDASFLARCIQQDQRFASSNCSRPPLKCLNGTCATQTRVLLQDDLLE